MKQSEKQLKLELTIFDIKRKTYCNVKKLNYENFKFLKYYSFVFSKIDLMKVRVSCIGFSLDV